MLRAAFHHIAVQRSIIFFFGYTQARPGRTTGFAPGPTSIQAVLTFVAGSISRYDGADVGFGYGGTLHGCSTCFASF